MRTAFIIGMRRTVVVVVLAACFGAAAGCSSSAPDTHGRIPVVAAENFWGNIASQIGGARVHVTSLISDPNADPHLYESDARAAESVAAARVVIVNGAGYDDFVGKLLGSTSGHRSVITAAELAPKVRQDANPHLWYDLTRVRAMAATMEQAFARDDAAHSSEFAANERHFDAALQPIDDVIATIRTHFPHAPVAYTERVPGYLLQAAGLDVVTPSGFARAIEDGNEPSAADTQRMKSLVSQHRLRVLLYNAQATSKVTSSVRTEARNAGVPVIAVTETMPVHAGSYQAWQLAQATELLHALEESASS
jgi:zinc/manganese transport system substrate-binding protein